jgi:tetratricopeptide (TPR) repeat protein
MKRYSFFLLFAALTLLASCDDYLDIQPKGELIPKTAADYESMLNYSQLLKASASYPIYMTDDAYIPDVAENDYAVGLNTIDSPTKNLYTFQDNIFGDSEDDELWFDSYNRIYYYNVIIQNIMGSTEATETKKRAIKAEALASRAFEYLNLVNAYGRHYDASTASTDPGVPLVLTEDITQKNLTRASVQAVYDQVMADLQEAEPDLPAKATPNAYRASKAMGLGMLARTYLYMGNYKAALDNANKSLEANSSLLDLKQYSVVNAYAAIGRTNVPSGADNVENIYIRMAPYVYGVSGKVYGSDDLLALYSDHDKRLQLYFTDMLYGVLPLSKKMWTPYLYSNLAMSTAEMYLIAAECEARIGSPDRAMLLLNTLRDNRIDNNTHLTAANGDEALKLVLDERRREFAMQGLVRLIDLKRLNKDPRFAKTVTHVVEGTPLTLQPNDNKYVLPIPQRVLRFNPGMPQNER